MEIDPAKVRKYNQAYRRWIAAIPEDCYRYECDICYCLAHVIASATPQKERITSVTVSGRQNISIPAKRAKNIHRCLPLAERKIIFISVNNCRL